MKKDFALTARVERIVDLPYYTEGPAIDRRGDLFFTTLSGGVIFCLSAAGERREWARSACPNGQAILPGDEHLVCDSQRAVIMRFDRNGKFLGNAMDGHCANHKVFVPNDVVADADGNVYFTDSVRHTGKVCCVGKDGNERIVAVDLDYPNGLTLSADGRWLYVAESYRNRILKIGLHEDDGNAVTVLADLPAHPSGVVTDNLPDGIRCDREGRLWIAHYGMGALQVISPDGKHVAAIKTGIPLTSNLVFENDTTLMVTGGYGEPGPGAVSRISL